jgi:uncharacterized protein
MMKQPMRRKHVPQRTCVACRQQFEKRELTRLVYTANGLQADRTGKMKGRGAYLCGSTACWYRAYKTTLLDRALRVSLSQADKQPLLERFSG